jgi:hypothetical protein
MLKWTAICLLATGCVATQSRPLASLPVAACQAPVATSPRRVVVGPFVDARGGEFGWTRRIPVADFFHHSALLNYPESAGVLHGWERHGPFMMTGSLDTALPSLLAQAMQQMRLTPQVAVATQPNGADYFVTGRLTKSALRTDSVPIAAVAGALFGVPFKIFHFDLEYEIEVWDARIPSQPIFRRTYSAREKRLKGLYYNHDAEFSLLRDGLEETLPQVVRDIAQVIAATT